MLFTISSIACGLAWSLLTLVVARALLGLGAAATAAVTPASPTRDEPMGSTPEEFRAFLTAEHAKWGKVVRDARVQLD